MTRWGERERGGREVVRERWSERLQVVYIHMYMYMHIMASSHSKLC